MRGHDDQTAHLFSYVSLEQRVPASHPLRAIRQMTDRVLATLCAVGTALLVVISAAYRVAPPLHLYALATALFVVSALRARA